MSAIGDLLEAMHDAPRAASLHAKARRGDDHAKMQEAIELGNRSGRAHVTQMLVMAPAGATIPSGLQESKVEFWYASGAWRIDQDSSRTIAANGKLLRFHPGMGGVVSDGDDAPVPFDGFAMYFTPVQWLAGARFRFVDEETQAQRSCWRVATDPIARE